MTVHVISVGLSILDSLETPSRAFPGQPDLAVAVKQARPATLLSDHGIGPGNREQADAFLARALTPAGKAGHDAEKADKVTAAARAVRPDLWAAKLSAELSTFDRPDEVSRPLPSSDIAVLICSDTPDGLLAGLWNAAALTGNDLSRVTYLALPQALPADMRGQVIMARVSGMDAVSSGQFARAMGQLGALGRDLLRPGVAGAGEPFRFYLSGGYKAAIPYLIGLAEGIRSLDPDRPVRAFVLHERAADEAPLIELPLRYLIADEVERELSRFVDGVRKSVPLPSTLHGYAYDIVGKECRLTAFGVGLRALFGCDIPGLGG